MSSTTTTATINVPELISACIECAERAGEVIREVALDGQLMAVDKAQHGRESDTDAATAATTTTTTTTTTTNTLSAEAAAAADDPQTVADRRAQHLIIESLRKGFPGLNIVGEEEGLLLTPSDPDLSRPPQRTHPSVDATAFPADLKAAPTEDVCVWVDPLDATREFTRGQYECVTTLIGITFRAEPLAGIISEPFYSAKGRQAEQEGRGDDDGVRGHVTWGCVGVGAFGVQPLTAEEVEVRATSGPGLWLAATAVDREKPSLTNAISCLAPAGQYRAGGSGNKLLRVIEGKCDVYLQPGPGTYRWDICAGAAILAAMGGGVTDRNGKSYSFVPGPHHTLANTGGILGFRDTSSCLAVSQISSVTSDTADIMRGVDGTPLTLEWLRQALLEGGFQSATEILSFDAPSAFAVRQRHSSVARVLLRAPPQAHKRSECEAEEGKKLAGEMPKSLLLKRCVVRDLPPRPPAKLLIDVTSYHNEAAFYRNCAAAMIAADVRVPRPYHVSGSLDTATPDNSGFLTLVESLHDLRQAAASGQTAAELRISLTLLARWHAAAWGDTKWAKRVNDAKLWSTGGYWHARHRERVNPGEGERMLGVYTAFIERMRGCEDPAFAEGGVAASLGQRISAAAAEVSSELYAVPPSEMTLVHGDFKSANIFFDDVCGTAAVIDFQWTGPGVGAGDVVYLFTTSASPEALPELPSLLDHYYTELTKNLARTGRPTYSRERFDRHIALSTVDYGRMCAGYFLKNVSPDYMQAGRENFNRGIYMRYTKCLAAFLKRISAALDVLGM